MGKDKEERLRVESLEEEIEEIRGQLFKLLEVCLPPKEVRREIIKNIYSMELSALKILKALLDYKVSEVERKIEETEKPKRKAKKVKIE